MLKYLKYIAYIIIVNISCSTQNNHSEITINISESIDIDSVSVYLDRVWRNLEEPIIQLSKKNINTTYHLKPDKYILIIHSEQYVENHTNFLIPQYGMKININIDSLSQNLIPTVHIDGFELNNEYISLKSKLQLIDKKIHTFKPADAKKQDYENIYYSILNELEELQNKYSPFFKQAILDKKLGRLILYHPVYYQFNEMKKIKTLDSLKVIQFFKSEAFKNFLNTHIDLLKKLDKHSILLNGEFFITTLILENILEEIPLEIKRAIISETFFADFLNNFIKTSSNEYCKQRLLHQGCALYEENGKADRARDYCERIKKDYPDYLWVKNGDIDTNLKSLDIVIGVKAPTFELESISGEILSLAKYKNDFLFIIFFHPNCYVCKQNMVYYNNLHQNMIDSNLNVIGISISNVVRLKQFKNYHNIKFPILYDSNEEVFGRYGVAVYPLNFLISPNGKILAKNLKSDNLIFSVKREMKKYMKDI